MARFKFKLLVGGHEDFAPDDFDSMDRHVFDEELSVEERRKLPQLRAFAAANDLKFPHLPDERYPDERREIAIRSLRDQRGRAFHALGDAIIDTDVDLGARFNVPGLPPKFERIVGEAVPETRRRPNESIASWKSRIAAIVAEEEERERRAEEQRKPKSDVQRSAERGFAGDFQTASPEERFGAMTVEQLREVAAAEEIDLGSATRKADILKIVCDAMTAKV